MKVKDKVCVVTGAAGGIGEAIARRYAKEGAKGVVVADRDAGRLEAVAKDIRGHRRRLRRRQGSGHPASGRRSRAALRAGRRLLLQRRHRPRRPRGCDRQGLGRQLGDPCHGACLCRARPGAGHAGAQVGLSAEHRQRGGPAGLDGLGALRRHQARRAWRWPSIWRSSTATRASASRCSARRRSTPTCCAWRAPTAASVDGVLNTDAVAQTVIEAMDAERFLILTHPEVKEYMARKLDRDRWLRGMRRLRDKTGEGQNGRGPRA